MHKIPGVSVYKNHYEFVVWAPFAKSMQLELQETAMLITMEMDEWGYWFTAIEADQISQDEKYYFIIDHEKRRPDPASMAQPDDIHGPSRVVDLQDFSWSDHTWKGIKPEEMIIYELHVGTFSEAGTFEGLMQKLDYLAGLGINTIEIMPVGQFPGYRNWGYDGVYPYAVQWSYGGPYQFQKLINACHNRGIAVILDVIYNHLGPEGNYLWDYGPYFTKKYATPWGEAINFDDAYSDPVRNFFIQNALMWFRDFHVDALRLDAVHAIVDRGAYHFLEVLHDEVKHLENKTGRSHTLIAECDLNDIRYINPKEKGGYAMDAQWVDEFHHALHALITGEDTGYYEDFGSLDMMAKAYTNTFVYDGVYSPHRKKFFGSNAGHISGKHFVVFTQNHDQTGNRMMGERLAQLVSFEMLKVAAGAMFISPYIPMLFMGEEYAETHPFLYFISHTDEELVKLVREGRKNEFKAFHARGEAPDPAGINTFEQSKLQFFDESTPKAFKLFAYYQALIKHRKENPVLKTLSKENLSTAVDHQNQVLCIERWNENQKMLAVLNFGKDYYQKTTAYASGPDNILIDSADMQWGGPGNRHEVSSSGKTTSLTVCPESIVILQYD